MGTCMSKDKKGATAAAHTASASSASSSSSQGKHIRHLSVEVESPTTIVRPSNAEENAQSLPITISRPSSAIEGKEPTSTDKHVVEIRLPIASPNKFKASPASATLAARAMAAIARPADEESAAVASADDPDNEEEDDEDEEEEAYIASKGPSKLRNPCPPLFYSSYLSRASFSRDLAAFSRDIASLSSSPLKRSPSVNGAHDLIAAAIKAAHSPHYLHAKTHSNMLYDDYSTNTRSRSLPKRFYGKDSNPNLPPLHKRSSSRDAAIELRKSIKRKPSIDSHSPCELSLSPRLSVRREEASGEYRVCARQAAARKGHYQHDAHLASSRTPDMGFSRKKERSPLRRSSTGKVADADQTMHSSVNQLRGRSALKDRSTNCSSWADAAHQGVKGSFKDHKAAKTKVEENIEIAGLGRPVIENELSEGGLQTEATQLECPKSSLYHLGKPRLSAGDQSDITAMYPASLDRVRSIIEALTELNMESSLPSEIEESETEVEGELDLLQFSFDAGFSPKKELQAQQARNMLLKEAAMDAFARPSFHSNMNPEELEEGKQPSSGLAALMSMRLTDAEADSLKIRKVLNLLSNAESEMGKEQKTLFYNQLRMVLDSVKIQSLGYGNNSQGEIKIAGNMKEKAVTSRVNSWPRSMKEPAHIDMSVECNSTELMKKTVSQGSRLKVIQSIESHEMSPTVTVGQELQEELSMEQNSVTVHQNLSNVQVLEPCKCTEKGDILQVSLQKSCGGMDFSRLLSLDPDAEKLRSEFCHANQENEHIIHQAYDSPIDDLPSAYEAPVVQVERGLVREDHCGVESTNKSECQVLDKIDDYLAEGTHQHERVLADYVEVAACTVSDHTEVEGSLLSSGVLEQPQSSTLKREEICSHEEVQSDGMGCVVAMVTGERSSTCDSLSSELSQQGPDACLVNDVHCNIHPPESVHHDEDVVGTFLNSNKASKCDDVASDGSFEFRVRSTASTPLSTPSTPMISTASTPRHLSHLDPPLTAEEIAEIWEAFE
eukprot:c10043_g1_i2 orf=97-3114(-)